jgi:hypothetical protein
LALPHRRRRVLAFVATHPAMRQFLAMREKMLLEHDPEKPAPDVIGGGHRFSEKIMLHQ